MASVQTISKLNFFKLYKVIRLFPRHLKINFNNVWINYFFYDFFLQVIYFLQNIVNERGFYSTKLIVIYALISFDIYFQNGHKSG